MPLPRCVVPTPPPVGKLLLTRAEVAFLLGVCVRKVDSLVSAGAIPSLQLPHCSKRQFNRKVIERWIETGCPKPRGKA